MAKTIKINGATYSDVKKVTIPLANGSGNAEFIESDEIASSNVEGSTFVADWNGENAYNPGEVVKHNSTIESGKNYVYYICTQPTQSGATVNSPNVDTEHWRKLNGEYKGTYDASATYHIGDIVESNGTIYQTNVDNPDTPPYNDMANRWTFLFEGGAVVRLTNGILSII